MKISKLETFATEELALVQLTDESGGQGWGQLSTYHSDITARVFHRQVAPWALGRDTDDLEVLLTEIGEIEFKFPGSYVRRALGGLDTAVWDLRGKQAEMSVCELLGGTSRPFPVYASSMRRDIPPADEARRLAQLQQDEGYQAFKFRIAKEIGHDEDEWPGRTEEIVPAVRHALEPDSRLMVDANCGYSADKAIEIGRFLDDNGVSHFEEPCPYWEYEQTAAVRAELDRLAIQVAGGEQDCDLSTWRRLIDSHTFDIVQPDIMYVGGLSRAVQVATMADAAGLRCMPHSANLSLVTVFSLHLMGAITNGAGFVEWSIEGAEYYPWQYGLYDPVLRPQDGNVPIPEGPGWGVEIRDTWLDAAEHRTSELPV